MMRILLVSNPHSIHTANWVDGLQQNGVEVDVLFVSDWAKPSKRSTSNLGVEPLLLDLPSITSLLFSSLRGLGIANIFRDLRYRTKLHQSLTYLGKLINEITLENEYDLIHAHGLADSALLAKASRFYPYTASAWGSDIYIQPDEYRYIGRLIRQAIRSAAFVHVESHVSEARVRSLAADSEIEMFVSTWGVDTSLFQPRSSTDDVESHAKPIRSILSLRALEPLYRIEQILHSFAVLAKEYEDIELVVCSDGSLRSSLVSLADSLGILNRTRFPGYVDEKKKKQLLADAYLYVQCPESDGVALTMMEAMSSGLPVISTDVGETSVLVDDGVNGILVNGDLPNSLTSALRLLLEDPNLRDSMGIESRRIVVNKHSRKGFFERFVATAEAHLKQIS
ncbi:MAG: glycosyltransferase [Candidatus Thorarchaeota archaeon]